jgi:CBS domain-containing protein/ribosome-associated translation inhibitor RaiA
MARVLLSEDGMRVQEIMSTNVATIQAKQQADVAWSQMNRHQIRHLVALDGSDLVGIVSDRDLGGRSGADVRRGRTVEDLMTSNVVSADPNTTLRQAANLMRSRKISCLPVLDGDRLVGIVTSNDVLDELGRGSSRPTVRAERRILRLPAGSKDLGGRPVVRQPSRKSKVGRARRRRPNSSKRAPLAGRLPRALKRRSSRAESASRIPAHIRQAGGALDSDDRTYIRRKLGMKLGKFATSIERVSVRVEDENGPRGGVDQVCRIKVVLSGLPSVVFEAKDASLDAAVDGALTGIERMVRRTLVRRRSVPSRAARSA